MDINKMTKKEMLAIRHSEYGEDIGKFRSVVIIPGSAGDLHDSGYRCMTYLLADDKNEPICLVGGGSDVMHIDGIGGYGEHNWKTGFPQLIKPKGWSIDCLPKSGLLHLFTHGGLSCDGGGFSSFEIFSDGSYK